MPVLRAAWAALAAIGRHWALLVQGFLLMVWVCSHLIPAGSNKLVAPGTAANEEAPSALKPASTSASAYLKSD